MIQSYTATIVCDGAGAAVVYAGHNVRGRIIAMRYVKGTLHNDTDLTIVGETSSLPVYVKANMGAADLSLFPMLACVKAADGSAATISEVLPVVYDERIKVTVADGGAAGAGSVVFYVEEETW